MFNKNPSFGFSKLSCLRVELGGVGGGGMAWSSLYDRSLGWTSLN